MELHDPPLLAFDDVTIDFAGRRLRRQGVERPLEPKAFGVLALLASAPGQVFARDEILDAVWGHRHVTPGVLNRVMTLLRHALGEHAQGARYLHTVHGVGYRFDLPAAAPPAQAPPQPMHSSQAPQQAADHDRPRRAMRVVAWTLPALVVLAFAGWRLWPHAATDDAPAEVKPSVAVPASDRSVAVLPFVDASHDADQQFFSDGLSDNLIGALSRYQGLKVIGRMSSFRFRDGKDDAKAIGARLGAAYLVDGKVQRAGDMVRINATLTRSADGSALWAEHYDRPYKDLFALQDELAQAIASALHANLLSAETGSRQGDRPPSGNLEAYIAYLQGSKYWHEENFPKAAEFMTRAVRLDPNYAVAWADLSGSWSTVAAFWNEPPAVAREHMRIARVAANKALQLAPGLGSAHAARAYLMFTAFDDPGALAECRRAVQLSPNDPMVLNGCGFVLTGTGKLGEALRLRERLLSIEPLYSVNTSQYAKLLMATGALDAADKYLRTSEELEALTTPSFQRMYLAILRGDARTALRVAGAQSSPQWRAMNLAVAAQLGSDHQGADAQLAKVIANGTWKKTSPYLIAQAYALRGDEDRTVAWLERTLATGPALGLFVLADPIILRFRRDPEFIAFCEKHGLPRPSESEALSIDQIRASLATKTKPP